MASSSKAPATSHTPTIDRHGINGGCDIAAVAGKVRRIREKNANPPCGHGVERTIFFQVSKIGTAISGPRIADTNFTDTRIFLKRKEKLERRLAMQKDLISKTEQELQDLLVLITKRSTQKDEALRRLHASSHRPCSPVQRPRPSKARKLE